MSTDRTIQQVHEQFGRIYLGGIPSLFLNDGKGAFLSFLCVLTATEALGGFLNPKYENGPRFKSFVRDYFPEAYGSQVEQLWKLRNAAVHGFSLGPYKLTHNHREIHLTNDGGLTVLNAEDFYDALVLAARKYFDALWHDASLRAAFEERAMDPSTGVLVVGPMAGKP